LRHGAGYKSTPCVLRELGADLIEYGNAPDGKNINKECGSMHPNLMREKFGSIALMSASPMMAMPTACSSATRPAN